MRSQLLEQVRTHLNFLGYNVTVNYDEDGGDECLLISRGDRFTTIVRELHNNILLSAAFEASDYAKEDDVGYLQFLNALNQRTAATRCFKGVDSKLIFSAIYAGPYESKAFGFFLDLWAHDTVEQLRLDYSEFSKYAA